MRAFFAKYSFVFIWIAAAAGIVLLFTSIVQETSQPLPILSRSTSVTGTNTTPLPPPPPSVALSIVKGKKGNTLVVTWANLPSGTTGLTLFRGAATKATSTWTRFKGVTITANDTTEGLVEINIGTSTLADASFFLQATATPPSTPAGPNAPASPPAPPQDALFTSGTLQPVVAPPPSTPPTNTATTTTTTTPTTTATSTTTATATTTATTTTTATATTTATTTTTTPSGTPYYSPSMQLLGYITPLSANFYVTYIGTRIQFNWHDLPVGATSVVISRSNDQYRNWQQFLIQSVPDISQAYSFQVADDASSTMYYFKMDVLAGTSTLLTYGPIFAPPY